MDDKTNKSLREIMNDMAMRIETLQLPEPDVICTQPLSELEAFIHIDDLLCLLNKDYLNAKAHRQELVAMFGDDDAMAEVAIDLEDSAWCAMQTRYLELRVERKVMERAQRLMRQAEEKIADEKQRDKAYEALQFVYYMQTLERAKERNKVPKIFEIGFIIMMLFKVEPFNDKPVYSMRHSFAA